MKKAIVIGASSVIGKELAIAPSQEDYTVGLTARRLDLLDQLRSSLSNRAFLKQIDISDNTKAMSLLEDLIQEMAGVDIIVISAGTGFVNSDLNWNDEKKTIDVNVSGFAAMANIAYHHFEKSSGWTPGRDILSSCNPRGRRSSRLQRFESFYFKLLGRS